MPEFFESFLREAQQRFALKTATITDKSVINYVAHTEAKSYAERTDISELLQIIQAMPDLLRVPVSLSHSTIERTIRQVIYDYCMEYLRKEIPTKI